MSRLLALDVGTRRTGVAYADESIGIVHPLDTISHTTMEELRDAVRVLIQERSIDCVYIGLPLLPSGKEGSQTAIVREFASLLTSDGIQIQFIDERYTTPRGAHHGDGDASAACSLLQTVL